MRRRRQTANIPNLTHSNRQDSQHMAAADIRHEMRLTRPHATEPPQLTWPRKPDSRVYKTEDVNRREPTIKPNNYPNLSMDRWNSTQMTPRTVIYHPKSKDKWNFRRTTPGTGIFPQESMNKWNSRQMTPRTEIFPSRLYGQIQFQANDTLNREFHFRINRQMEFQTNDTENWDFPSRIYGQMNSR